MTQRGIYVSLLLSSGSSHLNYTHIRSGRSKDSGYTTTSLSLSLCSLLGALILILEILQFVYIHRKHELPRQHNDCERHCTVRQAASSFARQRPPTDGQQTKHPKPIVHTCLLSESDEIQSADQAQCTIQVADIPVNRS